MSHVLGMNCKAYFDDTPLVSTTYTSATWAALDNVKDLLINLETGEADITTRANSGWRATAATLKDGSLEFEMQFDASDAGFTAVQTAWAAGSEIALAAMTGDITTAGSQGLCGNFTITNFSMNQANEEAVMVSVTAKPSSYTGWYTVAGA